MIGVLTDSSDLCAGKGAGEALAEAVRGKRPTLKFSSPQGIAVHDEHLVAVADGAGGAVHLLDLHARTHTTILGSELDRFGVPMGLTWVGDRLFVADASRHEVIELDATGRWIRTFGTSDLVRPVGIAFSPERGEVVVVDGGAHALIVFDPSGRRIRSIGTRGSATGEFNFPTHLAIGRDRIAVADSGNFRVQILDLDGNVVRIVGRKGDGAGDLSLPKGLALDRDDHLWVVDAHFEVVQVFDREGRLLLALGQEGDGPGEFALPTGLTMDARGRIWVSDSGNRRLQVFEVVKDD